MWGVLNVSLLVKSVPNIFYTISKTVTIPCITTTKPLTKFCILKVIRIKWGVESLKSLLVVQFVTSIAFFSSGMYENLQRPSWCHPETGL